MDQGCTIKLRKALREDILTILGICADARNFQRESGFPQWPDGYPSQEVIEKDIDLSTGFMILLNEKVIGYCVIDCNGDKEYESASDLWVLVGPYAAIHRLALSHDARGRHFGKLSLECIINFIANKHIYNVRVDTGVDNKPMNKLLTSLNFDCRGEYIFSWGKRIAYEMSIDSLSG